MTNRAQLRFEANQKFTIQGVAYRVAEHPALPGLPYVQRGGRGFVVQLVRPEGRADGERMALKYFKLKYRVPELVSAADSLRRHADLPGLRAAQRVVFTKERDPEFTSLFPALEYGMLMPWLPGVTWYDVVTSKSILPQAMAVRLAQSASMVLAALEQNGLSHCDIAGANVMVDKRLGRVELVDIEEMFGADLPRPVEPPAGQDGYQHRTSRQQGQWRAEGDRFGGAVLLAEMLGWANHKIRQNSADEHYFAAAEMQDGQSMRFRLLCEVLAGDYGQPIAELLRAAWASPTLAHCPTLANWQSALAEINLEAAPPAPTLPSTEIAIQPTNPNDNVGVVTGKRQLKIYMPNITTDSATPPAEPLAVQPAPEAAPSSPEPSAPSINLEGKKLCRNCGAVNDTREPFCGRCGFYIGSGVRRPPVSALPANKISTTSTSNTSAKPSPAAPSQPLIINRDANKVVMARRMGGNGRRVETNQPSDQVEANAGQWLVLAIIVGAVATILIIAFSSGG
jgi:hypothetical protein